MSCKLQVSQTLGPGAVDDQTRQQLPMIGERTNVTAQVARPPGRNWTEASVARPGPRRQRRRREHGRGHARLRAGDDDVPQLHRDGAGDRARPDRDDSPRRSHRSRGLKCAARASSIDLLKEGEADFHKANSSAGHGAPSSPWPSTSRVRRTQRSGKSRSATARKVADQAGRFRSIGHHHRPERSGDRDRARRAQQLRNQLIEAAQQIKRRVLA